MASPAEAAVQVNGHAAAAAAGPGPSSPSESQLDGPTTTKRKREASDDGSTKLDDANGVTPVVNDDQLLRDERTLIRDYFDVLQRYDTTPSILKRPLPDASTADEPQSKRHKSDEDVSTPRCIEDKVNSDAYKLLDQLVLDLKKVIDDRAVELRSAEPADGATNLDDDDLIQLNKLKEKALDMHHREMSYPSNAPTTDADTSENFDDLVQKPAADNTVLTVFGQAPQGRHLFSSLPKRHHGGDAGGAPKPLTDAQLPYGLSTTTVLPPAVQQKPTRVPTLGELFPSQATFPPVEAPKSSKAHNKGKLLGFYHPELAEQATHRHDKDSYFVKELTTGVWLDYSNATPGRRDKDHQRDMTLDQKPSSSSSIDVEITEMEALFRGAFSSFAPEKDDGGAVISSGEVGRVWYQRLGYRYMQQLIAAELADDVNAEADPSVAITDIEEEEIAKAIENWDDSLVDPSLTGDDEALAKKTEVEKELDDTLQEISDLIETLSSYQRNRHLTLPTSQNRGAADPTKPDNMLGSPFQEPSEEERETYEMLKDQLAVIVSGLPPYAVARLNSDKLEELSVSTKIEVRSDVYKGVMEEDEAAARLRQHQQQQAAQAAQTPRQPQRTPSYQNATPYQSGQQFNHRQFQMPNQTPQQPQPGMQPQYQQQPGNMTPHMNGTMQTRTMSPQMSPPYQSAQGYSPRPGQPPMPQARPSYGTPGQPGGHPTGIPRYPSNGAQPSSQSAGPAVAQQPAWAGQMSPEQRYQHQLQQRNQAIGRINQFNEKMQQSHHAGSANHHGVAGLGGIGLGGPPVDYQKLAQFRANMPGGIGQTSPSPRLSGAAAPPPPAGMNGVPQQMTSPSPGPMQGATPSPAPSANVQAKPPTPV
ncbi:hypothetical protein M406DRAFT_346995 [Cryphonectria parasitica EP155]|uniref:Uncharacterized protein n=1 Tax=Cryphonectria parasitica (strain ATCC 38755 / EP155) TaxID=660469 RepID=A0A9P5CMB3_CRYP1|nr:uncharacterized protein M406DRAFT_346995 [Cryphonectria parasitica EP155]KAF3763082.1 hypothetical protein M406DRAFT_346995 [Cryphonectria parasitica EP155]